MEPEDAPEIIEVREEIYKAAEAFDGLFEENGFLAAEYLADYYARAEDEKQRRRWREITDYLKCRAFMAKPKIIVLP